MALARLALRRLLVSVPVLFLASILVFTMVANSGDPLERLRLNPQTPPAVIVRRAHELHLDRPVVERYQIWISHFVRGDFGTTNGGLPVRPILTRRLLVTARMVVLAVLLAVILAVAVGVISAVHQYSSIDYVATFAGFVLLAMPIFWFASLLKEFLAVRLNDWLGHQFVYTIGDVTPGLKGGVIRNLGDYTGHLVLPTIALTGLYVASWSRFQRASMLDVLHADYVRVARAKGLSRARVVVRHALRNALIPLVTVVSIDFAGVLGGAIITEKVFEWQGMGLMLINAVKDADTNQVLAWLMVSATIVVVFNLATDILYAVLDPRIKV